MIGALAAAIVFAGPAAAQTEPAQTAPTRSGGAADAPTVTIINKSPDAAKPAPPALAVSPEKPASPAPAKPQDAAPPAKAPAPAAPAGANATAETPKAGATAPEASAKPVPDPANGQEAKKSAEPAPLPTPTLNIDIDLTRQVMTVSEDGAKLYTWRVSTARYGYRTPTGTYRPTWMAKMWYSRQYDLAPMPHAIFFHKGVAIHATYETRALGRPASHGCVRLAPKNAATLFKLVGRHGKERTQIVVHGRPDHSGARVASDMPRGWERPERLRRGAPAYRYLPPSYYDRRYAYDADDYYYPPPRTRRYYAAPRRPPRGFYSDYPYGYGF